MTRTLKRALFLIVILLGMVAVFVIGKWLVRPGSSLSKPYATSSGVKGRRGVRPVMVIRVQPVSYAPSVELNGTLRASESVDLLADSPGRIASIHFQDGQAVKKGDLLVRMDARELHAELQSARAKLQLAQQTEQRQTSLFNRGLLSKQEFDKAVSETAVLKAHVTLLSVRSEKTLLRASFNGHIGLRQVSPGAMVNPSSLIATIRKLDPLYVDFSVPERYQAQVTVGTTVSVTVEGIPRRFEASVIAVDSQINEKTRTLQLRALLANPEYVLFPGSFARISIPLKQFENTIMIPSTAVERSMSDAAVFVVDDQSRARRRVVSLGVRDSQRVQVLSGLNAGDLLVQRGMGLIDGTAVRIVRESGGKSTHIIQQKDGKFTKNLPENLIPSQLSEAQNP